jgi:hypothetical protein
MSGFGNCLGHPLAEALLRFNLLPALSLHPERADTSRFPQLDDLPTLQRHRSAALLHEHALAPVLGLDDPALPLAMLPDAYFDRLLLLLGATSNARHVRRTIARDDLARLKAQLGEEGLAVVRMPLAAAMAGLPGDPEWDADRAAAICKAWGEAVLAQAFEAATPQVGVRAGLRLSPGADALRASFSNLGFTPDRALQVARELLHSLEPAWLSSFPATH